MLPLYIESIGYNADQEDIDRKHGWRLCHWIQTVEGEGTISFEGKTTALAPNSGVLLLPEVPHSYKAATGRWTTLYLTFGGSSAGQLLGSLQLLQSAYFSWEPDTPFSSLLSSMVGRAETDPDVFGLNASVDVYRFLITLQKFGQFHRNMAISRNLGKIMPLIGWMNESYPNPEIGLKEMTAVIGMSSSGVNLLFRETFGLTPYAYLLNLRLRKAKELLINQRDTPVKEIAGRVGFRDASHFIASFRKSFGMAPEQFRRLY